MPRVLKKTKMKAVETPTLPVELSTPLVEEKMEQPSSSIERPPAHLIMVGMLVLVATSFILGGRAFAGLQMAAAKPQPQPTHASMMGEIQKLNNKIDGLNAKLDALDAQCENAIAPEVLPEE